MKKSSRSFGFILCWVLVFLMVVPAAAKPSGPVIEGYALLPSGSAPGGLVYGPQQALWVTGLKSNAVYRVKAADGGYTDAAKAVMEVLPIELSSTAGGLPLDVTIGIDQQVWVSDQKLGGLYHVKDGDLPPVETHLFPPELDLDATQMVTGRDQAVWFTAFEADMIGRLDANGDLSQVVLEAGSHPLGISNDAAGNLWFTAWGSRQIGRVSLEGDVTMFDLPSQQYRPVELVRDPSGSLWLIYDLGSRITRLNPVDGSMQDFQLSTASQSFMDVRVGPDGRLWLLGTHGVGRFEISAGGPLDYQETLFTSPVFDGQGRSQLTSGGDGHLYFTRLDQDQVYRVQAEGASLRDLQLTTRRMPTYALAGASFYSLVDAANWSEQTAQAVELSLTLDAGIRFESLENYDAAACSVSGLEVRCALGDLPASSSSTLRINLSAEEGFLSETPHKLVAELNLPAQDYYPENNQTEQRFLGLQQFAYFNDFGVSAEADLWSHTRLSQPDAQHSYLGPFVNDNVSLAFEPLPRHDRVRTCFQLYVNGGWDGDQFINPQDPTAVVGPDIWAHYLDENDLVVTTFSNQAQFSQSYPQAYRQGSHAAQQGAREVGDFDGDGVSQDARYDFCFVQPHRADGLKLTFYGVNLNGKQGESWGLDNVSVQIYNQDAFDWLYLPMIIQ